jgi:homopolymeric O-antigen transport system permease protein
LSPVTTSARRLGVPSKSHYAKAIDHDVSVAEQLPTSSLSAGGRGRARRFEAKDVLVALSLSDLRARYGRGPWQLAKWLLDPFAVVGVYLLLVTFVLDRPGVAPGLSLACAVVPFQLVMATVINSMGAVDQRRAIILNMSFRRALIPLSAVLTETVAFAGSLVLLPFMMAAYRVAPSTSLVWLPLVLAANIILALGLAYPASLFGLAFRDLRLVAVSLVRTAFFLAAGLVALSEIPGRTGDLVRLNPLTGIFEAYRDVFLFQQRPAAWELLYPVLTGLVLLAVFVPIYRREQQHFAKVLE